jgi:geranylgeranyl pyrophosphate synthase
MVEHQCDFVSLKGVVESEIEAQSRTYIEHCKAPLGDALAYALSGEGKRVRPILCLLASGMKKAADGDFRLAKKVALALEMIHTYSLVHDDLPCMDDDSLRRGRPTTHVKYGEWTALLVGDALLTDALNIVSSSVLRGDSEVSAEIALRIFEVISRAIGSQGMIHGQSLDMSQASTWQELPQSEQKLLVEKIHSQKTGCLLAASLTAGYLLNPEASLESFESVYQLGMTLGLAFQIQDDLLDGSSATGKTSGKDVSQGKLCYPAVFGVNESTLLVDNYFDHVDKNLDKFFADARPIRGFIKDLRLRKF